MGASAEGGDQSPSLEPGCPRVLDGIDPAMMPGLDRRKASNPAWTSIARFWPAPGARTRSSAVIPARTACVGVFIPAASTARPHHHDPTRRPSLEPTTARGRSSRCGHTVSKNPDRPSGDSSLSASGRLSRRSGASLALPPRLRDAVVQPAVEQHTDHEREHEAPH
jgi:hypothetical protein